MDLKHQKTIFIRLIFAPTELFQFNIMFLKETVILISNDPQCIRKRILHESQRCPFFVSSKLGKPLLQRTRNLNNQCSKEKTWIFHSSLTKQRF